MNNTVQISCNIDTTDVSAQLGLTIKLNDNIIFNSDHVNGPVDFFYDLNDDDARHKLAFIMRNKTSADTVLDSDGVIIKDARLIITNLVFEGIELKQLFVDRAVYTHSFNGTQAEIQEKFYGEMGCNGTVSLEFTTPIYLWLLENM